MMKIGFDISQTSSSKAGCGYFAHALIEALLEIAPEHTYSLFTSFGDFYFNWRVPFRKPYKGRNVHYYPRHLSRGAVRDFWDKSNIEVSLGGLDIIHSNNFWCPTQLTSSRLFYTFYDMGFAIDPNWTTEANRIGCFEGVFRSAVAADWVIAISQSSRDHYLNIFPHFPDDRIRVIYPGSRFVNSSAEGKRPKALNGVSKAGYWLNVGTIEPRKNQRFLIEAYSQYLSLGGKPLPLVLAGGKGWLMEDFTQHIRALGIAEHVIMMGYLSDEELIWLYRNCYANLYPSLFEGFGLPVIEGMQFGAASLVSNSSSLPEVVGKAAIMLDPKDIDPWSQAMLYLSRNPDKCLEMCNASRIQAKRFSWKQSAISLLKLYDEAIASPKRREMFG